MSNISEQDQAQDIEDSDAVSTGLASDDLSDLDLGSGLIIAAPSSGSGKTVMTLGLLRALARRKLVVRSVKVGPDYIDPAFHALASGQPAYTLDLWAMRQELQREQILVASEEADLVIAEGVMGLFDGSASGVGSTAEVAIRTGWPVVLVVDAQGQGASAAALVRGFATHHPEVQIAGVILNRTGSDAHEEMIRAAFDDLNIPDLGPNFHLGSMRRREALTLPERHLGLVQAAEHKDLDHWISYVADIVDECIDVEGLIDLAAPSDFVGESDVSALPMLGSHIAIANDLAFAFTYDHVLDGWHSEGVTLSFFSPLANEAPDPNADAVYLPGGYPELHAATLANADTFRSGMHAVVERGGAVFGECGGYMALGDALIDRDGQSHKMLGLLPIVTSFEKPRLHLGYRQLVTRCESIFGAAGTAFRGHEFHYATELEAADAEPLFDVSDSFSNSITGGGCIRGRVMGSFQHLIDQES